MLSAIEAAAALESASERDDWAAAADLIDHTWIDLTLGGHLDALGRVVAQMPEAALLASTTAGLIAENVGRIPPGTITYDLPESQAELEALGRSPAAHLELLRSLAAMAGRRRRGEHRSAAGFARRGAIVAEAAEFAMFPEVDSLLPFWHLQAGITAHLAGDDGLARRMHRAAYRNRDRSRFDVVGRDSAGNMALIEATVGHLVEAEAWLDRARAETHTPSWVGPLIDTPIAAAGGLIALDRLDLAGSREFLGTAAALIDHDEHWPTLLRTRVGIELTFGHAATAQQVLAETRDSHAKWTGQVGYGATILALCAAEVSLARGRGVPARRALEDLAPDEPMAFLTRTRLALLSGDFGDVDALAQQALPSTGLSLRHRLELLLLAARASERQDHHAVAVERLAEAVRLHQAHRSLRQFAVVPRDFLRSMAGDVPGLDEIIEALAASEVSDIYPESIQAFDLTDRERALLTLLESGDALPLIAARMSLSINTVRTHLANLRRKLDARSRDEVVANARRHGLLA